MRSDVTAAEIDRYRENGFLVVEDLLSAGELAELTEAVERAVRVYGDRKSLDAAERRVDSDTYYDRVFVQRLNLWKVDAIVRRFMLGVEIGRMAGRLSGVDLRVWHDQTLQKQPWANPTSWHLDVPYWSFHSRDAISVWIALDDSTIQNGCMYYLPGSHREVGFGNAEIGPSMADLFSIHPQLAAIDPVAAPMKAGSCGFHNGLCAHAAGPNMTPRWRRAMTCAYMPAGSVFNGQANILSRERLARLHRGDALDDDDDNPIVFAHVSGPGSGRLTP